MSWPRVFAARLRGLLLQRRLERELDDEVRFHLEMQAEDNRRAGMNPAEAHYAAMRSFGGVEPMKEAFRERRTFALVETVVQDVAHGARSWRDGCSETGNWRSARRSAGRALALSPYHLSGLLPAFRATKVHLAEAIKVGEAAVVGGRGSLRVFSMIAAAEIATILVLSTGPRFTTVLLFAFAGLAIVLGLIGVYGVMGCRIRWQLRECLTKCRCMTRSLSRRSLQVWPA